MIIGIDLNKQRQYGEGEFLEHLCRSLDLGGRPDLIRYNTNLIYDCGDFIVRLTPNSYRPRDEVVRELHWMQFVATRTRDVVQVLGDSPTDTQQIEFDGEHFTVTRLEKIIGDPINADQWNETHFERLGALTGFLHRIGQQYAAPADVDLSEWNKVPDACLAEQLPDDDRNLPGLNQLVFEHMAAMPCRKESYGPIHYDIHPGNYLMTPDGRMVLFDFENSCRGHYINDIAVVLYYSRLHKHTKHADEGFNEAFLTAFWKGYETAYPVPVDEIEEIPWLLLNRSLIVYGYLFKIWPGERDEEQNEVVDRVERSIVSARESLGL